MRVQAAARGDALLGARTQARRHVIQPRRGGNLRRRVTFRRLRRLPRAQLLRLRRRRRRALRRRPPPRASRPRRGEFEKRARATKDEVEAALFRCFEARPAWTFAELHSATDQPAPWLREVLAGVAAPVRRPGTKDVWELKADYRVGGGR